MSKIAWFVSAVLLLVTSPPAHARPGSVSDPGEGSAVPYRLDGAPRLPLEGWLAVPGAAEEFLLTSVDPEAIAADPETLTFDLPLGLRVDAVRTRFVDYKDDWKSWFGTLRVAGTGDRTTGYAYFGYHGDRLTALIDFRSESYQIVGGPAGSHRLVRLSGDRGAIPCGTEELDALGENGPPRPERARGRLSRPSTDMASALEPTVAKTHQAPTRLDVLAVFPKVFFGAPTSQANMIDYVQDSIALANDGFTNSNVNAYYNLLYVGPLVGAQPPATGVVDGRSWLNGDPAEVVSLRNAFGADIVTLLVPFYWDEDNTCGIANVPDPNGNIRSSGQPFSQRAFSVVRQSCGLNDFTIAHEIGHNYGMRHETESSSSVHLFPNGRGYELTVSGQDKATIMACTCGGSGEPTCTVGSQATCNRIPHFSNEWVSYGGVPTGDSTHNNALVGGTQVGSYSAFRAQSTNTPPNASFTVSCAGSVCYFNASGSTDNATIPSSGYHWDFGDGTTGSGKTVNHTYSYGSFFVVHLVVTDSGGQEDFTFQYAIL